MSAILAAGIEAARKAASIIQAGYARLDKISVNAKGRGDVVTDIDRAAERAIIEHLHCIFPEHAFLGEESGMTGSSEYCWIIDPLDGTLNFAHGLPHFCISIALTCKQQIEAAIVLDPIRNELFYATLGEGAWLNKKRINVSACRDIESALLATVFPKPGSTLMKRYRPILLRALDVASGVRRSGSMVLDLAYVAAGRFDGFWEFGMHAWDTAAGSLLITEAGGVIQPIDGQGVILESTSLLACTPDLAPALHQLVRGTSNLC